MIRIQDILDKIAAYDPQADQDAIRKAYVFAAARHAGQVRLSGEPYLSHPLAVADTLADLRLDEASIMAGLLHDTVEDTHATIEDIDEEFGEEVADIVDGVTKISLITFDSKEEQQAENIRKMILAMSEDMRVLIVKLADRLHNMRTLDFQKPEKQVRIANETMDIYAPLANRLGLHRVKLELEDLSFRYIKPDSYAQITKWLEEHRASDNAYIDEVINTLRAMLKENEIEGRVKGRIKHTYSIYRKMTANNLSMDEMHDIIAFRVLVPEKKDCYAVLGLAHAAWKPVPGRFKDYISMPKANMYQSLHTTVIGPRGERMEIQIRTEEMDSLAEHGLASHWLYKEGGRVKAKDVRQFNWLREMLDWQKIESDSREFLRSLRFDLFKDEIYVFTPKGEVKELPENATPVDFAYQIHTKVGDHCTGAKVNGRLVPLSTALKSGDVVEIVSDQSRHPSRDWLKFVKTAKARTRIQQYVRTEERARSIALGKEMLDKQGRRHGLAPLKNLKDIDFAPALEEFKLRNVDELLSALGYGKITISRLYKAMQPKAQPPAPLVGVQDVATSNAKPERKAAVSIAGVSDMLMRFAKCCNPVPGDPIVGYSSHGRGLIIHTVDCPTLDNVEIDRLFPVYWPGTEGQDVKPYQAKIYASGRNQPGLIGRVTTAIGQDGVNIQSGSIRNTVDSRTELELVLEVRDRIQLEQVMEKVRRLPDVIEVLRIMGAEQGKSEKEARGGR